MPVFSARCWRLRLRPRPPFSSSRSCRSRTYLCASHTFACISRFVRIQVQQVFGVVIIVARSSSLSSSWCIYVWLCTSLFASFTVSKSACMILRVYGTANNNKSVYLTQKAPRSWNDMTERTSFVFCLPPPPAPNYWSHKIITLRVTSQVKRGGFNDTDVYLISRIWIKHYYVRKRKYRGKNS